MAGSWLMISDLDGTFLNSSGKISSYSRRALARMIREGAKITFASARTCATIGPMLNGLVLPIPVIIMNGSACYDFQTQKFLRCKQIPYPVAAEILGLIRSLGLNCFTHCLGEGRLDIYYDALRHPTEESFYQERKDLALKRYHQESPPAGKETVYLSILATDGQILQAADLLKKLPCSQEINASHYSDVYHPGDSFLEIYHKDASKKNAVLAYREKYQLPEAVFGDNLNDLSMMEIADRSFAVGNAVDAVKQQADEIIGTNDEDAVAKTMEVLFYKA